MPISKPQIVWAQAGRDFPPEVQTARGALSRAPRATRQTAGQYDAPHIARGWVRSDGHRIPAEAAPHPILRDWLLSQLAL
jgi:hypothetical protein